MSKVSFTGETLIATCDCHKDKTVNVIFLLHPMIGRMPIGEKFYDTGKEAEDNLQNDTMIFAHKTLHEMGLDPNKANRVKVAQGNEAVEAERNVFKERNERLH